MSFIALKFFKDINHLKNIELVLENLNLKKTMTIKNDTILIVDDISNVDANVLKNNIKEFLVNYNIRL
jgi:hypoxanthine phosphoribosyltransferase